jgi:hypothetical protein
MLTQVIKPKMLKRALYPREGTTALLIHTANMEELPNAMKNRALIGI